MLEKLEKVLDLFHAALTLYIDEHGGKTTAAPAAEKVTKTRKPKIGAEVSVTKAEITPASPFGDLGGEGVAKVALSAEEALEARRRGQEVMGLFIRRYLKANPTGLDRAKKVINEVLGGPRAPKAAWQLEDILPEDWLKLTPIFEAELDKADPK